MSHKCLSHRGQERGQPGTIQDGRRGPTSWRKCRCPARASIFTFTPQICTCLLESLSNVSEMCFVGSSGKSEITSFPSSCFTFTDSAEDKKINCPPWCYKWNGWISGWGEVWSLAVGQAPRPSCEASWRNLAR